LTLRAIAAANDTDMSALEHATATHFVSGATQANPVQVTTLTEHGYASGDRVAILGVSGMVELNNRVFLIANATSTTFELQGEDGTGHTAFQVSLPYGVVSKIVNERFIPSSADIVLVYDDDTPVHHITDAIQRAQEKIIEFESG